MFDLEQSLGRWRQQMKASGVGTPKVIDELESHLREALERRIRSGENAEKAFEFAVCEIGDAPALKTEFAKARGVRAITEKLMLAVCVVFVAFIVFLSGAAVVLCFSSLADRIVAGVGMAATLITACLWSRVVRFLPVIADTRVRVFTSLACILTGIGIATFYCQVILPHFGQPYDHQVAAAGFWMLLPVAAGFGIGCGFDLAGRRHTAHMAA
jgi:hypothetical protein